MKKHIPNCITLCNICCGVAAIILALKGAFLVSFLAMLAAAVFDFLDGMVARAIHAYSEVGRELDSLCDVVSFGVAPAMMLWGLLEYSTAPLWARIFVFAIVPASALRLAIFNVDTSQSSSFRGLPTPACAIFAGSIAAWADVDRVFGSVLCQNWWFIIGAAVVLAGLLVSRIPMFSLKIHSLKWSENKELYCFGVLVLAVIIPLIFLRYPWPSAICALFALYIGWNLIKGILSR
ncbi:MAG: CDP-diacylglycerol--serine O-phosphatidyltransferase [Bacteroidales bacterium]|nr:CDP-diacylglycerol--serine O-phosphatidyltransferase [Bacteroidales bacterium]